MRRGRVVALQALCLGLLIWLTLQLAYTSFSKEEIPTDDNDDSSTTNSSPEPLIGTLADNKHQEHHHQNFQHKDESLVRAARQLVADGRLESISEAIEAGLRYQGPSMEVTPEEMEREETARETARRSRKLAKYVGSILDPRDESIERMSCPQQVDAHRYGYLQADDEEEEEEQGPPELKYFFALNLRDAVGVMPRLLGSVLETMRFLGPESCALSIVEGHSADDTYQILRTLAPELERMGVDYFLQKSDIDPLSGGNRIAGLAELRNLALEPLISSVSVSEPPTVIFLNDVVACPEDILELLHQRFFQSADMTCAMDWKRLCPTCDPVFYDVWVARALSGNLFFDIPSDGSYDIAWDLLFADAEAQRRYYRKEPFQVYACWNGAVAFTAAPLLGVSSDRRVDYGAKARGEVSKPVRFRASREGECYMGEPTLFCKDLWWAGYGRIAVVPTVALDYSNEGGTEIKASLSYTSEWTRFERRAERKKIRWIDEPPEKVICMVALGDQHWEPWDEALE